MINLLFIFAASNAEQCAQHSSFFGLKPWYFYLPDDRFYPVDYEVGGKFTELRCMVKDLNILPGANNQSDIPLILLAVADDLLRIAGLVAVAFVIVGAVKLIISQGNPEDTANAQSTIINALIGLAVAIVSVAFVALIGRVIGG